MCLLTGATSLLFFVQGFRWRTDAPHSASLVTWVVATISINNTFAIGWLGLESAFYGQVIVQAGPGFVGMTWARFFFLTGVILSAFVIGDLLRVNVEFWCVNSLTISGSTILSILMQQLSSRYRYHLNTAQEESERQRQAAEKTWRVFRPKRVSGSSCRRVSPMRSGWKAWVCLRAVLHTTSIICWPLSLALPAS